MFSNYTIFRQEKRLDKGMRKGLLLGRQSPVRGQVVQRKTARCTKQKRSILRNRVKG